VTIPGSVFFLPNEVPQRVADVIVEAIDHGDRPARAQAPSG
jgi:hypothetical protein